MPKKVIFKWLRDPAYQVDISGEYAGTLAFGGLQRLFLYVYAPHLNPIERLWGVMHKWVTHNHHYATFNQFTEAILGFFRKTLPDKWREFRDTVTDNFRVVSLKEYRMI